MSNYDSGGIGPDYVPREYCCECKKEIIGYARRIHMECDDKRRSPPPAVTEGWKLVPVEPTQEMMEVAILMCGNIRDTWGAMVEIAPSPPPAGEARAVVPYDAAIEAVEYVGRSNSAGREQEAKRQLYRKMELHPPAASGVAAWADVLAERQRQVSVEGWTPEHDDQHAHRELATAAACYALHASGRTAADVFLWPWDHSWWKPTTPRRNLVKAAALILAEIERLDRAALSRLAEGK